VSQEVEYQTERLDHFAITYGYSRDYREYLKQWMLAPATKENLVGVGKMPLAPLHANFGAKPMHAPPGKSHSKANYPG